MKSATLFLLGGLLLVAAIVGVTLDTSKAATTDNTIQDNAAVWQSLMRQKLERSQKLLEALAIADFERITTSAEDLQRISLEARWIMPHSPEYAEYGDDFRHALTRVVQASENQNIDGAALSFVQVILTCVQCHKVVREGEELARLPESSVTGLLEHQMMVSTSDLLSFPEERK